MKQKILEKQVEDYNDFIMNLNKRNQEFATETIKKLINDIWEDIIELKEDEKANNNLLRDKIDALLNHYNGYYCGKIIAWSLIEE